jgi:hypothetical protein
MLVASCADKDKCIPEGPGIGDFDGKPIRRQRGMIYWYRWGRHSLDVRVLRKLLGLPEDHEADKYFMEYSSYFNREADALRDIVLQIREALGERPFRALVKEHDAALRAA